MNVFPISDRLAKLPELKLDRGSHSSFEEGHCAMELVSWLAGERFSDSPKCVSLVLRAFLIKWNDDADDEGRQKLKLYLVRVLGTAGDGKDEARGWLAVDWVIRHHAPAWLELAGITESAAALRELPPIRDLASLSEAQPSLEEERARSAAAWDVAWDVAWDAARAAAWEVAWGVAWDVARKKPVEPTQLSRQVSALELLERMIDPGSRGVKGNK